MAPMLVLVLTLALLGAIRQTLAGILTKPKVLRTTAGKNTSSHSTLFSPLRMNWIATDNVSKR